MTSKDHVEPALGTGAAGDLDNPSGRPQPDGAVPPEPAVDGPVVKSHAKKEDNDE